MTPKWPIYLDNQATTPLDPRVLEAMLPYFQHHYGNASSKNHELGWVADAAVEKARAQIAALIGAQETEIIFTSGATEANNLAIQGAAQFYLQKYQVEKRHFITTNAEHPSVLETFKALEKKGFDVTFLPVDRYGQINPDDVDREIRAETVLVAALYANNEIGTLNPVAEIGKICKKRGVLFFTDAVQAASTQEIDVQEQGVDLLSLSAHKMYGPKGVGALYLRRRDPRVQIEPIHYGGGHERGLRSGTLNVPAIVGFGEAARLALENRQSERNRLEHFRSTLLNEWTCRLPEVCLNGHPTEHLPHNLNLSFAHVEGESFILAAKELAVSSGSACASARVEPSHVLKAIGLSDELSQSSIRLSWGRFTTVEEIEFTRKKVVETVRKLRDLSPLYHDSFNDSRHCGNQANSSL